MTSGGGRGARCRQTRLAWALIDHDAEWFAATGFWDRVWSPSPIAILVRTAISGEKNGMDEERKALMVFGIIVVLAAILIATALVMNLMVG